MDKVWETKLVHTIEYYKFNELVEDHLDIEYEIVADEELRNDSTRSLGPVPSKYWNEDDEEKLAKVLAGEKAMYSSRLLAHELCRRGVIPPGNWQVTICW